MRKIVIIPDSFKGTLSSIQICKIIEEKSRLFFPDAEILSVPLADGGEGTVDCFLSILGGEKVFINTKDPYMNTILSFYGILPDKKTAIIEMAASAGLPLVENCKNPLLTTTYGVGELILDSIKKGVNKIILGLGGSATNDFGCGLASACGIKFFDKDNKEFIPVGKTLKDIVKIDISTKSKLLDNVEIITMCDIDNVPYGKDGASYVFASQKGALKKDIEELDFGVKHVCNLLKKEYNLDLTNLSGGGAAGAMGAGMMAFFNSKLKMGIYTILDTINFSNLIKETDIIFTGEGRLDNQSLRGKTVIGIAREAKKFNIPVISIVGGVEGDLSEFYEEGITSIFTINRLPQDFSISKNFSEENLSFTIENILRTLKLQKYK